MVNELEKEGLIVKKIFSEVPIRDKYPLTNSAKELQPILKVLDQ